MQDDESWDGSDHEANRQIFSSCTGMEPESIRMVEEHFEACLSCGGKADLSREMWLRDSFGNKTSWWEQEWGGLPHD